MMINGYNNADPVGDCCLYVKDFISVGMDTKTFLILKLWLLATQKPVYRLKLCGQILITWMRIRILL
jgi:hypothetical protein